MKKPWLDKKRGIWYLEHPDGRINLGRDRKAAFEQWHVLQADEQRQLSCDPAFAEIYRSYAQSAAQDVRNDALKKATLKDYCSYADLFCAAYGNLSVSELRQMHLTDLILSKPTWGPSAQRAAIKAINCVLNWGHREGRCGENPFKNFRKPPPRSRDTLVPSDTHQLMVEAFLGLKGQNPVFRQFALVLIAFKHTGGRPQDIAQARVEFVDEAVTQWMIPEHKRLRSTRKPKVVHLSPCLHTITKILMHERTQGPLFRGRDGAMTVGAIGSRIKRLKKRLNIDPSIIAYSYRHTYITESLENDVSTAAVAELTGTSLRMIEQHYGHVSQKQAHLKAMAAKAMGADPKNWDSGSVSPT